MRFIYKLLIKGGYLQYRGYCRLSWFYSVVYFSSKEMQLWVFQLEGSLIGEGGDHLKFGMGVGGDVTQRTACAWVAYARV